MIAAMDAHENSARDSGEHLRMLDGLTSQIGERLRKARIEAGLSQGELGQALGYAPTMISAFENGRRRMKLEDLARVCIAMNKQPTYFLRTGAVAQVEPEVGVALKLRAELADLPSAALRDSIGDLLDELDRDQLPQSRIPNVGHLKPEAAARNVRDHCRVDTPGIEMEDVLDALGVPLYRREFPDALSALVVDAGDERYVIAVNERHHENRRRFSIAHELGHAVLRHESDYYVDYWDNDAWEPPGYRWEEEREANQFAAALLMDDRALRRDIADGIRDVHTLAERYKVSEAAMNFRLINLGLT